MLMRTFGRAVLLGGLVGAAMAACAQGNVIGADELVAPHHQCPREER